LVLRFYRYFIVSLIASITYLFDDFIDLSQPSLFFLPAISFLKKKFKIFVFQAKSISIRERYSPSPRSPPKDCVVISISRQNVMLNLFQHLIKLICYETLKRVQGDKKWITTQSPKDGGGV